MTTPPIWTPPKPPTHSRLALVGSWLRERGRSMLNLLPPKAYQVQMGVARLARQKVFLVNAPETVREVMVECPHRYPKHHFLADILEPLIGISLFNANGPMWQQQRLKVDQAFESARLRQVFPLMLQAVDDLMDRLARSAQNPSASDGFFSVDMDEHMGHVTADIIFRTLFSNAFDAATAQTVYHAFNRYQHAAQRVMGLSALRLPTFWHRRQCRLHAGRIRAAFAPLVQARFALQAQGAELPNDMLTALMQASDPNTGERFSEGEVIDQVGTLFLAGHETSASTLAWALYLLAHSPERQQQLRQEVDALWAHKAPSFGDTRQLKGLHNVLKETLRLYPPIAFYVRKAAEPGCLRDKPVQAGDMVVVSPWTIHRHQSLWSTPDAFCPERFESAEGPLKSSYLPFGLGERACPGAAFATQESLLVLAKLLQHFVIAPEPGHEPQPVARLTLRSANGIRLRLQARNRAIAVRAFSLSGNSN